MWFSTQFFLSSQNILDDVSVTSLWLFSPPEQQKHIFFFFPPRVSKHDKNTYKLVLQPSPPHACFGIFLALLSIVTHSDGLVYAYFKTVTFNHIAITSVQHV